MKYEAHNSQGEILPNLLGLATTAEIEVSEFEGFLKAEILLSEKLTNKTRFDTAYILKIHKLALGHLYSFAGSYRDVNLSKGGFPFAAAKFLAQSMESFNKEFLLPLPNSYDNADSLIVDIAKVHGELLFIHPFREGNGRTARILANLMCRKQGYHSLQFEHVGKEAFDLYVSAVQSDANKDYSLMTEFIKSIFPA